MAQKQTSGSDNMFSFGSFNSPIKGGTEGVIISKANQTNNNNNNPNPTGNPNPPNSHVNANTTNTNNPNQKGAQNTSANASNSTPVPNNTNSVNATSINTAKTYSNATNTNANSASTPTSPSPTSTPAPVSSSVSSTSTPTPTSSSITPNASPNPPNSSSSSSSSSCSSSASTSAPSLTPKLNPNAKPFQPTKLSANAPPFAAPKNFTPMMVPMPVPIPAPMAALYPSLPGGLPIVAQGIPVHGVHPLAQPFVSYGQHHIPPIFTPANAAQSSPPPQQLTPPKKVVIKIVDPKSKEEVDLSHITKSPSLVNKQEPPKEVHEAKEPPKDESKSKDENKENHPPANENDQFEGDEEDMEGDEDMEEDEDEEEDIEEPEEIKTIFWLHQKPVTYPEGVWSPTHPQGKKVYPVDFLMQFSFMKDKPSSFTVVAELMEKAKSAQTHHPRNQGHRQYSDGGQQRRGMGSRRGSSRGGKQQPPPQNLEPVEPLKLSENRWIRPSKEIVDEKSLNEITFRKIRGILNKLTVEKYEALRDEIFAIEILNTTMLNGLITLIFEKATDEPSFSFLYARLCSELMIKAPTFADVSFRKLLLNTCQIEFEKRKGEEIKSLTEEEKKSMTEAQLEEDEYKRTIIKRKTLGNIVFISELFELKMLSEKIMHECIVRLLKNSEDERDIECLCNLLKKVGKTLDTPQARNFFESYFNRIQTLSTSKNLPSRIRFMLKDAIDLRQNNWIPRREELKAKKIEEVHNDVRQEEISKRSSSGGSIRNRSSGRGGPRLRDQVHARVSKQQQDWNQGVAMKTSRSLSSTDGSSLEERSDKIYRSPSQGTPRSTESKEQQPPQVKEQQPKEQPQQPEKQAASHTRDKFLSTVINNLGEFFETKQFEDAASYMGEFVGCEQYYPELILVVINQALEKREEQKNLASELLTFFHKRGFITESHIIQGLEVVNSSLDDICIDIPGCADYIGKILSGLISEGNLPFNVISKLPSLKTQENGKKVFIALFKTGAFPSFHGRVPSSQRLTPSQL